MKKNFAVICSILMVFTFFGCNMQGEEIQVGGDSSYVREDLCYYTSGGAMAETEQGFFYKYGDVLYYADKSDLTNWVAVCNEPKCGHNVSSCSAYVVNGFYLSGNRIYSLRNPQDLNPEDTACDAVYSMALDGTGIRLEYIIPNSSLENGGFSHAVIYGGNVYSCYSELQNDGTYINRLQCSDLDGTNVLYESTEAEGNLCSLLPAHVMYSLKGDKVFVSVMLANENPSEKLFRLSKDGIEDISGILEYNVRRACIQGASFSYFLNADGYYQVDLNSGESRKWQDTQMTDSTGYCLANQFIVETNFSKDAGIVSPKMYVYNGSEWKSVELPDACTGKELADCVPLAVSSELLILRNSASESLADEICGVVSLGDVCVLELFG